MSEILNKKALVEVVAEKLEMTKKDATVAVETVSMKLQRLYLKAEKLISLVLENLKSANVLHVWESTLQLRNLLKSPLQKRRNSKLQKH